MWFPSAQGNPGGYIEARRICEACPVQVECLAAAMWEERDTGKGNRYGMVGGKSPYQRHELSMGRGNVRVFVCDICGGEFEAGRKRSYCSDPCRRRRATDRHLAWRKKAA